MSMAGAGAARWLTGAGALLTALALGACASSLVTVVIESPTPGTSDGPNARAARSYPQVIGGIRRALEDELGVLPPPFQVVIFPDRDAFARGLEATGQEATFARATAQTMDGVGVPGRALVNGRALGALTWAERTAMLAHEVVHVLQYAWAGGKRGASAQWLREGFAEWLTGRVMVRLDLASERDQRRRLAAMHRRIEGIAPPPLVQLRTFPEWLRWVESRRDAVPYDYAALAVERLVARHGIAALVDYFTRFVRSHDGDRVFEDVFGQSIAQFDRELRTSVAR